MDRTKQEEFIFGCILLLSNKFQIWGDALLPDITLKQWFLLMLISKIDTHTPSVTKVAESMGTSRQNTKKMLEHLESKGYVSISKSETDSRALSVSLTPKTFAYFEQNALMGSSAINELFSGIKDADLSASVRALDMLLDNLCGKDFSHE